MAKKFRPTPLFWGLLGGTTAVSALTAVVLSLFNDDASAAPEAEPVEQTAEEIYNEGKEVYGKVKICLERDPGSAGVIEAKSLAYALAKYEVVIRTTGNKDKMTRFSPFSACAQRGDVKVKNATWNKDFFQELEDFTGDGKGHDDQVDGTSGAYGEFVIPQFQLGRISIPEFRTTSIISGL